jgi:pimeloyl-ACP methyl ester carboxylesterase
VSGIKGPLFVFLALVVVAFAGAAIWLWTPDRSRGELEALYLRSPDDMTEVAGTQLHARDDGPRDAPVLIMLHGFGSSLHTWEPWAQALVGKYRVIRLDLPGAGLSPPDPTNDYTDARSIALILALMDRRSVLRATLVGNSLGGRIAWTLAAKHPERTDKLVLISPDGFASPGLEYGKAPDVPIALQAMQYVLPKALLQMSLEPSYGDPSVMSTVTVDRYHHLMLAPGVRKALLARMEQTVLVPPKPLLRSIKAPVLLLWGEKDMLIPFSNAADYAKNVPDIRLVSFPELGHVPHEEAPELSLTPLRAFLTERS